MSTIVNEILFRAEYDNIAEDEMVFIFKNQEKLLSDFFENFDLFENSIFQFELVEISKTNDSPIAAMFAMDIETINIHTQFNTF